MNTASVRITVSLIYLLPIIALIVSLGATSLNVWLWSWFMFSLFLSFGSAAIRFSPSKRTRTSIPALKSSSQEILSSQADERNEDRRDRLVGARSLASLDGQGTQNTETSLSPWQRHTGRLWIASLHFEGLAYASCLKAFSPDYKWTPFWKGKPESWLMPSLKHLTFCFNRCLVCLLIHRVRLWLFSSCFFFVAYWSFLETLEAHKEPLPLSHKNVVLSALPKWRKQSAVDALFGCDGNKQRPPSYERCISYRICVYKTCLAWAPPSSLIHTW